MKTYPKYKDSNIPWIGRIPGHWTIVKTKYIFHHVKKIVGDNSSKTERLALTLNGVVKRDIEDAEGLQPKQFDSYQLLRQNQLVFKLIDLENVNTSRVGICPFPCGMVSPAYIVLENNEQDNKFYYYYFLSLWHNEIFNKLGGDGVRSSLNINDLLSIPTIKISTEEQTAIATYLDRKCSAIDRVIKTESRIIEKLKEYRQSLITETVSHGLNPHAPMKASGIPWIGRIPKHWEIKRLKFVATSLIKGNGITKDEVLPKGDIQCIRYGEIYSKYDGKCTETFSSTNLNLINSPVYVQKGDILFAGTGELIEEIGKNIVYMGDKACLAGGDIVILRHNQDPIFLNYALGSSYAQGQKSFGKSKLKVVHISAEQIGNMIVALPPLSEQKSIADFLDKKCSAIDSTISKKQQVIEKMTEYKKSLIYECVTGKLSI